MSGIKRGFDLVGDWMKLLFRAIAANNPEAVIDGISVGNQWLADTFNAKGDLSFNPAALLFGLDPWKTSRQKFQKYAEKWAGRL